MNIWRYFSAFGVAFVIFFGIYISESEQFELISSIKNPFEEAIDFHEVGKIETEDYRDVFTKNGEFFRLYNGVEFNFEGSKNREIISGEAFISALFVDDSAFDKNESFIATGFSQEQTVPKIGQINIGPALLHFPGATVFVSRDSEKEKTEIYVFGHSVDLFFDGFTYPFVIPSGMKVEIYEKLISEKTAKLFYSKLKKDLRMSSYSISDILDATSDEAVDRIAVALGWQKNWKRKMRNYAVNLPKTWIRWRQDSIFGTFIQAFKFLQMNFAMGISEEKKANFKFQNFVETLADANYEVLESNIGAARKKLSSFKMVFLSSSWTQFLEKNENFKTEWDLFSRAQRAWLRTILPDATEEVFTEFWTSVSAKTSFDRLEGLVFSIENCIANNQFKKARQELFILKKMLENMEVPPQKFFEITKMRRILVGILKNELLFQDKDIFEVYSIFIEKEIETYNDPGQEEEIRLENGQDLLFFLGAFLGAKTDIEIANVLLQCYQKLAIQKIAEKMDREIFTEKETEVIELIRLIGDSGLSEKDLKAIRDHLKYQEEFNDLISDFREEKNEIDENKIEENSNLIINVKNLKSFFSDLGINTDKMSFKTTRLLIGGLERAQFSEGIFYGKKVSGIFKFQTQKFDSISVGDVTKQSLNPRFLANFLTEIKSQLNNNSKVEVEKQIFVSQTTTKAILKRELIREIFTSQGFTISRENIKALNLELTQFEIAEAFWKEQMKVSFIYDIEKEKILNSKMAMGLFNLEVQEEIRLSEFGQKLDKEVEELKGNLLKKQNIRK